jgi:aminocarboxymuconate-semialdehyde decarboxylase
MVPAIDVHGHLLVPEVNALAANDPREAADAAAERAAFSPHSIEINQAQIKRVFPQLTDVTRRLEDMAAAEVTHQIVGPMPMHRYWAGPELALSLTRTVNEAVATHCRKAPEQLQCLGTLPLQHPDLALFELEYAINDLGMRGISVSTNVDGRELADPAFDAIWEAAAELGAVVFIHPWGCSLGARLGRNFLGNTVGQPAETTVALSHLIFSGTLDRYPTLKLLAAHGGGYLPTYIGRSDHAWHNRPDAQACREAPSTYLRRVWYDALVYTPTALRHLIEAVGVDRVMLGSDYPFDMGVEDGVARIRAAGLPDDDVTRLLSGNAATLFGLEDLHS